MAGYVGGGRVWLLQRAIYDSDGRQVDCDALGIYTSESLATLEMTKYAVKIAKENPIELRTEHLLPIKNNRNETLKLWTSETQLNRMEQYYADGVDGIGD